MRHVKLAAPKIAIPAILGILILAIALLGMLLVSRGARAEEATPAPAATETPAPAPAAPPAPTKFYLEVEPADLQAISLALMELPKKIADPLILKLNAQLQAPQQAQIAANKADAEKPKKGKK